MSLPSVTAPTKSSRFAATIFAVIGIGKAQIQIATQLVPAPVHRCSSTDPSTETMDQPVQFRVVARDQPGTRTTSSRLDVVALLLDTVLLPGTPFAGRFHERYLTLSRLAHGRRRWRRRTVGSAWARFPAGPLKRHVGRGDLGFERGEPAEAELRWDKQVPRLGKARSSLCCYRFRCIPGIRVVRIRKKFPLVRRKNRQSRAKHPPRLNRRRGPVWRCVAGYPGSPRRTGSQRWLSRLRSQ